VFVPVATFEYGTPLNVKTIEVDVIWLMTKLSALLLTGNDAMIVFVIRLLAE
jgi:hypothetical protein